MVIALRMMYVTHPSARILIALLFSSLQEFHYFICGTYDENLRDVGIFDLIHSMLSDRAFYGVHTFVTPHANIRKVFVI